MIFSRESSPATRPSRRTSTRVERLTTSGSSEEISSTAKFVDECVNRRLGSDIDSPGRFVNHKKLAAARQPLGHDDLLLVPPLRESTLASGAHQADDLTGPDLKADVPKLSGRGEIPNAQDHLAGLFGKVLRKMVFHLAADHHLNHCIVGHLFLRQDAHVFAVAQDTSEAGGLSAVRKSAQVIGAMLPRLLFLVVCVTMTGCQTPNPARLDRSWAALRANPDDPRAQAAYRKAATALLPDLLEKTPPQARSAEWVDSSRFSDIAIPRQPRDTVAGLHRSGAGIPVVGKISREKSGDPNAPRGGFKLPLTALVVPGNGGGYEARLADPTTRRTVTAGGTSLPLAMNLEAALDSAQATGPRFGRGLFYLLRADRFAAPAQLGFLQPYDPEKIPVVFVHGLMSTPRMWLPVIKQLMAVKEIRERYQFWFFYYPTGQPVPATALQFRDALDAAVRRHQVTKPLVLVGHSMGGIVSRAQASRIPEAEAVQILPWLAKVSRESSARRALIFEPRADIGRIIFLHVPHRGSRMALTGFAGLGMQLIRLPSNLMNEMEEVAKFLIPGGRGRMPTSIQGLSPQSDFLAMLNKRSPVVPHHTILGDRGRGNSPHSSDGVVPYSSAHLDSAESERIVPGDHGSFSHPEAIRELERILLEH